MYMHVNIRTAKKTKVKVSEHCITDYFMYTIGNTSRKKRECLLLRVERFAMYTCMSNLIVNIEVVCFEENNVFLYVGSFVVVLQGLGMFS